LELQRRARGALELAQVALAPAQPFEGGPMNALACDLCVQAVYWSLLAHAALAARDATGAAKEGSRYPALDTLLRSTDPALLSQAAAGEEVLEQLKRAAASHSFVEFANLSDSERAPLARDLHAFAERLVRQLDAAGSELDEAWKRRLWRLAPLALLCVSLALVAVFALQRAERARDLTRGKPWRVSSAYAVPSCTSPDQNCKGGVDYFFHTNEEEQPWVEIDLGQVESISGLDVRNRTDCCEERALPLVAEVSVKRGQWREVARRTEDFLHWRPNFEPTRARWVRLRVARRSVLHLARFRVLH
jgi:hypothetical protein